MKKSSRLQNGSQTQRRVHGVPIWGWGPLYDIYKEVIDPTTRSQYLISTPVCASSQKNVRLGHDALNHSVPFFVQPHWRQFHSLRIAMRARTFRQVGWADGCAFVAGRQTLIQKNSDPLEGERLDRSIVT